MAESGRPRTRLYYWAALALLVCAGLVAAQEAVVHTDDGCAVEVHCLACRWAYSADAVSVEAPAPLVLNEAPEAAPVESRVQLPRSSPDVPTPRGPPAAA